MNARLLLVTLALALGGCQPALDHSLGEKARALAAAVSGSAVPSDVEQLASLHLGDSKFDCASAGFVDDTHCALSNAATRAFVIQRFEELGLAVSLQSVEVEPPTTNIIADVLGSELPNEVILVGAHYDAFYSGADDNSSGVAVMLEAARVVSASSLRRTVRFVGFDLEEYGLVGSSRMVRAGEQVKGALVFDCVGYRTLTDGSQAGPMGFPLPKKGDFIAAIANDFSRTQLDQLLFAAAEAPGTAKVFAGVAPGTGSGPLTGDLLRSDHGPFWLTGQSAIFLTDTANFRNPNYHRATDVFASVDPEFLTQVARLTLASVAVWGDAP